MSVRILGKVPRENGMVDVTLSQGTSRFTVSVTAALDASSAAQEIYQHMADRIGEEAQAMLAIVEANRGV